MFGPCDSGILIPCTFAENLMIKHLSLYAVVTKSIHIKSRFSLTLTVMLMLHLVGAPLDMFCVHSNINTREVVVHKGTCRKIVINDKIVDNCIFTLYCMYIICFITVVTWFYLVLMSCGDIEQNPGPSNLSTLSENSSSTACSFDFTRGLSIVHYNVQSIRSKVDILTAELLNFDIILLSETWLNDSITSDEIAIVSFQIPERKDRNDGYGGVAVYVKDSVHYIRRRDLEIQSLECIWIEAKLGKTKLLVSVFYRPPTSDNQYFQLIENSISLAVETNIKDIIIMGDLNYNMLDAQRGHKINSLCQQLSLSQLITEPTHFTEHSSSLIDLVIASAENNILSCGVMDSFLDQDIRFHCPVFALYRVSKPNARTFTRKIWKYNECDFTTLHEKAMLVDWSAISSEDVDEYTCNFTNALLEVVGQSIPSKSVRIRPYQPPWFNNTIRYKIRIRKRLYRKAKRLQSQFYWSKFKAMRNEVVNLIRETKKTYYENLASKLTTNKKTQDWWNILKYFIKSDSEFHAQPMFFINDGVIVSDVSEKANMLNDFFTSQSVIDDSNVHKQSLPGPSIVMQDIVFTYDEVNSTLKSLPLGKASGPDGVDNRILKELADELSQPLCDLFNFSISEGIVPSIWKKAHVCAIFKGGDRSNVANYRPISLLSNIDKVMEKLVFKHIFNFLRDTNALTPFQSGFVPGDSTTNQLTYLYDHFIKALDQGKEVRVVFFDIRKAFDRVWHAGLLDKLQSYGISSQLHKWFQSYLENRQQRVVLPGAESDWSGVGAGVPQGSILGPLLFLIYINDIVAGLNSNIRLFADDTSLSMVIDNPVTDAAKINEDIAKISEWAGKWLVSFNQTKTESLILSRKVSKPYHPNLILNGQPINIVKSHKHLGLIISESGGWTNHIEFIIKKAWKRINIMRQLKYLLDRKSLETIYISFIRPILEYGDVVWCNLTHTESNELDKIQIEAARIATGATKLSSLELLSKEVGWESLSSRRKNHKLILFYKMFNGLTPAYLSSLVPPLVGAASQYRLRNSGDVGMVPSRTQLYHNSFLPSVIRDWNSLPSHVTTARSLGVFKSKLSSSKLSIPKYFYIGKRKAQILHCRLRLNCSALNQHLFQKNIVNSALCQCGDVESTDHFFIRCPLYDDLRPKLRRSLPQNVPLSTKILLSGDTSLSFDENCKLFIAVHDFILDSKRFH